MIFASKTDLENLYYLVYKSILQTVLFISSIKKHVKFQFFANLQPKHSSKPLTLFWPNPHQTCIVYMHVYTCMYICTSNGFEKQARKSQNTVFNFLQINGSRDSCQKQVLQFLYSNNARYKIMIMFVHFSILIILQTDALYRPRSVSSSEGNFYDTSCCLWTQ